MFSYPLYQRLRDAAPEFEEMTAFQAGGGRLSVRRAKSRTGGPASAGRIRHRELFFHSWACAPLAAASSRRRTTIPGATPVIVLSHHAWETIYGSDPSVIGSTFFDRGTTVHGDRESLRRGFSATPCAAILPICGFRSSRSPRSTGAIVAAAIAVARGFASSDACGRGASTARIAPRLTAVLKQWIEHDSGYPVQLDA